MAETLPAFRDSSGSLRLAELVTARLCHDFSGPLVALTGGLEAIAEKPASAVDAITVVAEAAQTLALRLRMLRIAWGEPGAAMGLAELLELAAGAVNAGRVQFDGSAVQSGVFSSSAARLLLNVLLLGAESLPAGGRVGLAGSPDRDIVVVIEGARAAWPAGFAAAIADEAAAWAALSSAGAVQAPLTALIARYCGFGLSLLMPAGPAGSVEAPPLLLKLVPDH